MRLQKRNWQNIHAWFVWHDISIDFQRQLVAKRWDYRWKLEHELLMDFHGYSCHASVFYKNMWQYIKGGLAYTKDLKYYADRIYIMYRQQKQNEWNASRQVYKFVDNMGRTIQEYVL